MKKVTRTAILIIFTLGITLRLGWTPTSASKDVKANFAENQVSPNEGAIAKALIKQGKISPNASQDEIDAAVSQYIKIKLKSTTNPADDKRARLQAAKTISSSKIGFTNIVSNKKNGVNISDEAISEVKIQKFPKHPAKGNLLVILADFAKDSATTGGPLYSDFPKPSPLDNSTMYVSDYSKSYYDKLLFSRGGFTAIDQNGKTLALNSMKDYFLEQSQGKYDITGSVFGWYTLPHPEAYYGDDNPAGGHDNLTPGTSKDLVEDLMNIVSKDTNIRFSDFDVEDIYDKDGDGNYNEPDGIIDHLVIMHAGLDQSAGGGDQGDNAIWAHSSSVNHTINTRNGNYIVMNYTIQGQDSGIGTFCHEYGHDLGLPDEYDTEYSGKGEPVGFWSIMSSGSWLGQPLDSKPSSFSAWGRYALGWISPAEVNVSSLTSTGTTFNIDESVSLGSNVPAVKANLPDQVIRIATPYQGSKMWYSGRADVIDSTMRIPLKLPSASNIKLNMAMMYDIEANWDFGFVQVSTDGGTTWVSLSSARTTNIIDPDGMAEIRSNLPGYTGSSGGWVNETLDLTPYANRDIILQIRYMTDWGTTLKGMFIDTIKIVADGVTSIFEDDGESGNVPWVSNGWSLMDGSELKGHYYLMEWRSYNGSDKTLENCYNFTDSVNGTVDFYRYEPGLVIWYRNKAYTENWVGYHPGYVYLGVVDAHPEPVIYKGKPLNTRLQIRDAAFNIEPVQAKTFFIAKDKVTLPALSATPSFSDNQAYWFKNAPDSGLKLPLNGLKISVLGHSPNNTVGQVKLYK